jgi:RNA:NAD 2'-phosphotransferase (TPT1/KptA family)/8-oxo-dGTP pyrophosphatase MutT (NUDIX family)
VRWYHGTSKQNAEKILQEGVLKPGEHSVYREDVPRYDAVYLTTDWQIAKYYSEERGKDGVVLEVIANENNLMPDEDSIYDALHEGAVSIGGKANKRLGQAIRNEWFKYWKSIDGAGDTFEEAWEAWGDVEAEGSSGIAEEMKALTEEIHEKNPALSKAIIKASGKAAHIGPVKVVGIAKKAAKKVKIVKTPGFVIEVPKERRTKFFVRPKAPLEYWAFKNRPRVFINEPLIFTFGGKPVAKAMVVRVEAPGKGEDEYKHWHKVYWKPTSFTKFKAAAEDPYLYHVTLQQNVDDILENGLKAEHGSQHFDLPQSTYLTERNGLNFWRDEVADYYGDPIAVLKVPRRGLNLVLDTQGTHDARGAKAYRVEQDIPPQGIELVAGSIAPPNKKVNAALLKSAAVKIPTFEQVIDKKTDTNNEFDMGSTDLDVWSDRNLTNMREYYDEVTPKLANLKFPLTVYRCFALKEGDKIDYNSLGGSWSLNSRAAYLTVHEMFDDEEYEEYKTITGKITSAEAVDWLNTVRAWMTLPEEEEIRLKIGAKVKVQGKMRTAGEQVEFYHGTSWEAADKILEQGLKAHPWQVKGKSGNFVWCTIDYGQAQSYGITTTENVTDNYAVVVFDWDWDKTEPDPEHVGVGEAPEMYRRIPGNVPASAIRGVNYYDEEYGRPVKSIRKQGALGDQHHHADDIPTPLQAVPNRPAVIDWYSDSPDVAGAEPELIDIDPKTLLTDQATVSKSHLDKALANIDTINEPTQSTSEEHSAHPMVLGTSEGDFIFDGNHRCAAALLKGITIKVLYLDLTPIEDWVPEYYDGEEKSGAKNAASKLPKGWRVTVKGEKVPGSPYPYYWGHIWKDNQYYGACGVGSEYRDKAREAAIDWAWQASGQPRPKTADEIIDVGDGDEYWAGEGNAASGVLPVCPSKGTVCLAWRSAEVMTPNCWGTIGGAVQKGKSPQQSAKAEMAEEMGYRGGITLTPAYVFTDRGFSYHNFIGVVGNEFSFAPSEGFGWETDHIVWVPYQELLEDMQTNSGDYHPGVLKLFANSKDIIERALRIKKQAGEEIIHPVTPEIDKPYIDEAEWQRINKWLISLQWRGRNPWYPEKYPWFCIRLFSDGWVASNDLMKETLAEGKDLASLKQYLAGFTKEYGNSLDALRTPPYKTINVAPSTPEGAIVKRKSSSHNPSCKCEMCASIPVWQRYWLTGHCDEFALALHDRMPDAEFVAIGGGMFEHVGLRKGDGYYDVRGKLTLDNFVALFGYNAGQVHPVSREEVMRSGGYASWVGHEDEFRDTSEMKKAHKAVRRVFGGGKVAAYYHGTNEDFKEFKSPEGVFYFTPNRRYAEFFADRAVERHGGDENQKVVHEVELDIKRPFDARRFKLKKLSVAEYAAALNVPEVTFYDKYEDGTMVGTSRKMPFWRWFRLHEKDSKDVLQKQGYDGVIQKETSAFYEGSGATSYVVFSPSQISRTKYAAGIMESRQPCPSGKRKFYDERSAIGPHKQWDAGTPNLRAYKCPKCGWFHLTSKPQHPVTAGEFDEADRLYQESIANDGKAPQNRGLYKGKPFWSGIADVADGSIIEVHTYEEAERGDFHHSFYVSHSSQQMMREGDYAFFWIDEDGGRNAVQVEWPTANQDVKIPPDLARRITNHIQFNKVAAAHSPEYAQKLIGALKQTVHDADFKVIGSVGVGGTSDNDLDILVTIHPDAVVDDESPWVETSGLVGAMKLMGFDYLGPEDFSPEESAEKSEASGKYLNPAGSGIEKFFNPNTMHTVEFWFTGMPDGFEKDADWKSKYVLPTALALTGLGVGAPPVHPGKATPQQIEQRQQQEVPVEQEKQPLDPADVTAALRTASKATGIPLAVLSAIAHNETSYGTDTSQGGSGSNGFMQMTPDALAEVNKVYGTDYIIEDMDDPDTAALAAAQYLHILLRKFDKNLDATIAAYNSGPAHINKVLADYGEVTPETLAAAGHQLTSTYLQKAKARMAPKTGSMFPTQTAPQPSTTEHPDVMYHYAGTENRASIQKHGLLGSKSSAIENAVFLDSKLTEEGRYTDTWEVNVKGLELDPDWTTDITDRDEWEGHTWWIFYGDIPLNRLKLVRKGGMAMEAGWVKKAAGFAFKSFKKLWHVGTMNPKDKRDDSYEGAGLSVSVNPDEWQMIAKIGGDLWELTKAGNKFVNFHRLSKPQRKQIVDWGIKNGYAQPAELWRHTWYDDELDDERYSDYATKEEAEAELGSYGEGEKVEPVKGGLTATPKLSQKSKRGDIDPIEVVDLLVTAYAEDELDCDGVWWADDLDPDNLSAPRGVIFPSKLSSWKKRKVQSAGKTAAYDPNYDANFPDAEEYDNDYDASPWIDPDEDPVGHYAHGACWIYALAVHDLTGLPMLSVSSKGTGPVHVVVKKGGKLLDSMGEFTLAQIGKRYGLNKPFTEPITEETVEAFYGIDEDELEHAKVLARKQLKKLGIKAKVAAEWKHLPTTDEWIKRAKLFLKDKWAARHKELGREGVPTDLKGACKFASLFAQKLFGGRMRGTAEHQVLQHQGKIIDLTDLYSPNTFSHDKEFWMNPEHAESMKSIEPRVQQWVDEFMQFYWTETFKTHMSSGGEYHHNVGWLLPDGSFQPLKKGESHREGAARIGLSVDPQNMIEAFDKGAVRVSGYQFTTLEFKECSTNTLALLVEFIMEKRQNAAGITLDWFKPRRREQEFSSVDAAVQWLETSETSVMASEAYLYHGTNDIALAGILKDGGMPAGSHWGISSVADYFAKGASEEEGNPVILRVPMSRFNKTKIDIDQIAIAEPLTLALGVDEDTLYAEWEQVPGDGTWQDCLRIYGAIKYEAPMKITKADVWT